MKSDTKRNSERHYFQMYANAQSSRSKSSQSDKKLGTENDRQNRKPTWKIVSTKQWIVETVSVTLKITLKKQHFKKEETDPSTKFTKNEIISFTKVKSKHLDAVLNE